jgi:hypothetical protein
MLLPLVVAVTIAHGFTVLVMRRSILTEKIARRGYHLSREYATDPLEILFVREVMRTSVAALPADATFDSLRSLRSDSSQSGKGSTRSSKGSNNWSASSLGPTFTPWFTNPWATKWRRWLPS